ncbi:hypothetical protein LIER_22331 [Lithospermum erythrorhizon]|uniref:Uncharacterized protein n=1 Tax=Lithospermum erythrorhizon TaxID=34254 RepID=A0AAV3QW01_LITER
MEGSEKVSNFVVFTARDLIETSVSPTIIDRSIDNTSDDEGDIMKKELMTNYQMLFIKWSKLTQAYTVGETEQSTLIQKNKELLQRVEQQKVEICNLEEKVHGMIKGKGREMEKILELVSLEIIGRNGWPHKQENGLLLEQDLIKTPK